MLCVIILAISQWHLRTSRNPNLCASVEVTANRYVVTVDICLKRITKESRAQLYHTCPVPIVAIFEIRNPVE